MKKSNDKLQKIKLMNLDKTIKFIDLFCGVGGIRLGMEKQGFECVFSCDINPECQRTYFENFGEMPKGDIKLIDEKTIPKHDILCAGFPCQPYAEEIVIPKFELHPI